MIDRERMLREFWRLMGTDMVSSGVHDYEAQEALEALIRTAPEPEDVKRLVLVWEESRNIVVERCPYEGAFLDRRIAAIAAVEKDGGK